MPYHDYQQGRGAQINPTSRFDAYDYGELPEQANQKTQYIRVYPKSILNKVHSPDIGMAWSLNPYQGCEHGCTYCYARATHPYWGYSAGLDFEQKILVKYNAPELLSQKLKSKNWQAAAIRLSGNTDCYQPAERQFGITRRVLEVLWRFGHPVGLITKNRLILRDLDLLQQLATQQLVKVSISLTTLDEELRRRMEPRTATVDQRLQVIEQLSAAGIPVNVMLAPLIPGLNDHEIMPMARAVADRGARSIDYTVVRLNAQVADVFQDWLQRSYPDRSEKVLNSIRSVRGGSQLHDSRFGIRMRGEGERATLIRQQIELARRKYFAQQEKVSYNTELYERMKNPQLDLF